ncbi:glycosyltransferase [Celeribacter ethanolicus]|uniref:Glycosyltransferase n=1 Tax=Celeribacter ethanolicus TaxID=1758178 RepID=A0A291GEM0_9RHOB|nr:glycosyltransferase [Celeribacter ethanolicus]ATG48466.1 glycosyltransferase [Celeribacter ethanolicus]
MRVAAIIATHNRCDSLMRSLERVLAEPFERVVVVNNASTDDTRRRLEALDDPRLSCLHLEENTGGAGGFSQAVQAMTEGGLATCDWLCLFDDDAWPQTGAIDRFRALAPDLPDRVGAVGAVVETVSDEICEMNRQGVNPFWQLSAFLRTMFRGNRQGFHLADSALAPEATPKDADFSSFVGFFLRRKTAEEIGPPEAGLFIYGDDVLYSLRLRKAGWRILVMPAVRFTHDIATFGGDFVYRPLWKIYYHCRNGVEIARQSAGPMIFPFALLYYVAIWSKRGLACNGPERKTYYRLLWRGLRDGFRGRRGRCDDLHGP